MLTSEKSIEVAMTVWKCKVGDDPFDIEMVVEAVNSWQGFGRTVEAMADNNNIIIDAAGKHFIDYMLGRTSKQQLWGRTHLAALEAMKNE